jgi:hypothetical protein
MTTDDRPGDDFGCERCWPLAADAAWEARRELSLVSEPIDESHFHVMILACPRCAQRFLSVFTETIDWVDGDDPQCSSLLPLTGAETDDLARHGDSLNESSLQGLGSGRRCLVRDSPKGAAPRNFWVTGLCMGPHD